MEFQEGFELITRVQHESGDELISTAWRDAAHMTVKGQSSSVTELRKHVYSCQTHMAWFVLF